MPAVGPGLACFAFIVSLGNNLSARARKRKVNLINARLVSLMLIVCESAPCARVFVNAKNKDELWREDTLELRIRDRN
jgi:hypothetical protein